jgi:hypothetical protein
VTCITDPSLFARSPRLLRGLPDKLAAAETRRNAGTNA